MPPGIQHRHQHRIGQPRQHRDTAQRKGPSPARIAQQRLCQLLGEEGLSIKEAAERLRIPRGTLYEEIKRIRRIFDQQGLGNYLKD